MNLLNKLNIKESFDHSKFYKYNCKASIDEKPQYTHQDNKYKWS